jgi:hypothetical protein
MQTEPTLYANIYIGLKEGYDGPEHTIEEVYLAVQEYCNEFSFAVTVTPTKYIYKNGNEDGVMIGLINYPRFPSDADTILLRAIAIGDILKKKFKQQRYSIMCKDKTYML